MVGNEEAGLCLQGTQDLLRNYTSELGTESNMARQIPQATWLVKLDFLWSALFLCLTLIAGVFRTGSTQKENRTQPERDPFAFQPKEY